MDNLKVENLSHNLYNYAMQQDMNNAKQTYIQLLNETKQNPSINIQDLLDQAKDGFFKQAGEKAMKETGTTAPIREAVTKHFIARDNIRALQKDKEIISLNKAVKKASHLDNGIILLIKEKSSQITLIIKKLLHK